MACSFYCVHCNQNMISLANGITYCENCGKVTSNFAPMMMPRMSETIFAAKRSVGENVPEGSLTIRYGWRPDEPATLTIFTGD